MAIIPIEQISRMVVNLREPIADSEKVGTGTLVVYNERPFVLTAHHVAEDTSINGTIVIKGDGDLPISIPIRSLVENQQLKWAVHPEADIAVFEIFPQNNTLMSLLQGRFLPIDFFFNNKSAPSRNIHLTSIGFPLGLGVHGHFSPLMFESRASSGLLSLPRADTQSLQTFFALENPSVGGYSGCPVVDTSIYAAGSMVTSGGGTCFYGIMHGTISDNTGGKIAMVTPSFYVHELFANF